MHCFLDGRDTPPESGKGYVEQLTAKMKELGVGEVGMISGRYYAMDGTTAGTEWRRLTGALTLGEGVNGGEDPAAAVQASYDDGKTDEFMLPTVMQKDGKPVAAIQEEIPLSSLTSGRTGQERSPEPFCDPEFAGFERERIRDLTYVCFTDYDETIPNKLVPLRKKRSKIPSESGWQPTI